MGNLKTPLGGINPLWNTFHQNRYFSRKKIFKNFSKFFLSKKRPFFRGPKKIFRKKKKFEKFLEAVKYGLQESKGPLTIVYVTFETANRFISTFGTNFWKSKNRLFFFLGVQKIKILIKSKKLKMMLRGS